MFGLGSQELLVILVIVLILFGANRLPELARSLGASMREFKKGINEAKPESAPPAPKVESAAAAAPAARTCVQCRAPLASDWTHCPRCGAKVEAAS
jgi:sec-independent protein translocase protein TatA